MQPEPWPVLPVSLQFFQKPPCEYGILPFWFLNGELDPDEMRFQLQEFRLKGMPGIILHGRYGLEMDYIGETYLQRVRLAVEEAEKNGLNTWIYDEMNWPSGTADKRVLKARPDLAQRYIECINFTVRGPWFTYLTGADSRYNDFERSKPVAAFAIRLDGGLQNQVIDLTPNLSFKDVIPWEAPAGSWRLVYIVEKEADYYIDALNPEATQEFLRLGYEPYAQAVGEKMSEVMLGFYTDEPAMHYYITGGDNPIVPWTKDMFRRFQERNGYNLRPRLPDLFFDLSPASAQVRYDFYNTLTDFYSHAYYEQIQTWCRQHGVLFTGHLLYEEWLRKLIRVEGNLFKHYEYMDVIGVDHLYPIIGSRDRPDEHVAMKVGSSAAHQLGSPRLLSESFGGIFMDATMQRMKWIADWEYVLGVNLLNPHGFHYTLEGPRKRDWPPSQFYQYPWWRYYGKFSDYIGRLSYLLSGGRHVAKVAVLWPIHAMLAVYTPQSQNMFSVRLESDFNALADMLLRLHYDYDILDEDILAQAEITDRKIKVRDEAYELVVLPPVTHIQLSTLEALERFVQCGGRVLGMVFLPDQAFRTQEKGGTSLVDISRRMRVLFDVDPLESQQSHSQQLGITTIQKMHARYGKTSFICSYALARRLPLRLQQQLGAPGIPESPFFGVESEKEVSRYYFSPPGSERKEITDEVNAERQAVYAAVQGAVQDLIEADVMIENPEIFYLHRVKDGKDIYFLVNPTFSPQTTRLTLAGKFQPLLWQPSQGSQSIIAPIEIAQDTTSFTVELPPVGSLFILKQPYERFHVVETDLEIEEITRHEVKGYAQGGEQALRIELDGRQLEMRQPAEPPLPEIHLDGGWEFQVENDNALVIGSWEAAQEQAGVPWSAYTGYGDQPVNWLDLRPGAWSFQLPSEPAAAYPVPVWYRIPFHIKEMPARLDLIVDGFAGSDWEIYLNGQPVRAVPVRSALDSQMQALEITPQARTGENVLVLRIILTNPTDGLLDLVKIIGRFALEKQADGSLQIAKLKSDLEPASWTSQGYPFYSGTGIYRCRFTLPEEYGGQRMILEAPCGDDVVEVLVNGQPAGVCLWEPYRLDISSTLQAGDNFVELRVANTLVNLLEAVERPSGLSGVPRLVAYRRYRFSVNGGG